MDESFNSLISNLNQPKTIFLSIFNGVLLFTSTPRCPSHRVWLREASCAEPARSIAAIFVGVRRRVNRWVSRPSWTVRREHQRATPTLFFANLLRLDINEASVGQPFFPSLNGQGGHVNFQRNTPVQT